MSSKYFGKRKPYNRNSVLSFQQNLLEGKYHFLTCSIRNNVLTCTGFIQPENCKNKYHVKIEYVVGFEPKSTILYPVIEPSKEIHMYQDHSLCLSYAPDMKWSPKTNIYEYTIPWIIEWIIFYEIYLINGGFWEGKESPTHISENDKNINLEKS